MTRKDFELIARGFAYCEEHILQDSGNPNLDIERETLAWIVEKVAEHIGVEHPRFNKGRFEVAALPVRSHELRDALITKALGIAPGETRRIELDDE